jgi:hypothetical protein
VKLFVVMQVLSLVVRHWTSAVNQVLAVFSCLLGLGVCRLGVRHRTTKNSAVFWASETTQCSVIIVI